MKYSWLVIVLAMLLMLAGCGQSENEEASEGVAIPTAAPRMTPGSALDSSAGADAASAQPTPTEAETESAADEAEEPEAEAEAETEPTATAEPTATTAPIPAESEDAESEDAESAADETDSEAESDEPAAISETAELTETVELTEAEAITETLPVAEEITGTVETAEGAEAEADIDESTAVTETAALDASTEISATEDVPETADAEGGATETLEIQMNDLYFGESMDNIVNPPIWTVTSGAEVALDLENMGSVEHNWALVEADAEVPVPFDATQNSDLILFDPGIIPGGESKTVTFAAPIPGVYTVICTVPGHYPVMQGRLEVK